MTPEERDAHIKRQRRERRKHSSSKESKSSPGSGTNAAGGASAPPSTKNDDKKKDKKKRNKRRSRRKNFKDSEDEIDPTKAWRFAQYDRVRCNLGESGWCSGNVQALDEPAPSGRDRSLPYVVMLDPPIKQLISVPQDSNVCVLPDVCFAA